MSDLKDLQNLLEKKGFKPTSDKELFRTTLEKGNEISLGYDPTENWIYLQITDRNGNPQINVRFDYL